MAKKKEKKKKWYCQVCGEGPFDSYQKVGGHSKTEGCHLKRKKAKKKAKLGRPKKKRGPGRPKKKAVKKKVSKKKTSKKKPSLDGLAFEITPNQEKPKREGIVIPVRIQLIVEVING